MTMKRNMRAATMLLLALPSSVAAMAVSEAAQLARGRILEALSSPSGKLTLSPEIVIPEPNDPTAVLLQASAITSLSETIRTKAKANTAWISGSIAELKTFCSEQEAARGNFPGPVPTIYCNTLDDREELLEISEAGASGILIPVAGGNQISSSIEIDSGSWLEACKSAWDSGLQPIPEVTLGEGTAASWNEDDTTALVEKLTQTLGSEPVCVLLTVSAEENSDEDISLPKVPKSLGKKIPIVGSMRVPTGRITEEAARFKEAGFTGAIIRRECVPGFPAIPDLRFAGDFWSACIGQLKSTRSKSFDFRSKNEMYKSVATQWGNLQQDVIDSGALGAMDDSFSPDLDSSKGEYKGF